MHFSHLNNGSGSKAGKMALVAGVHVLVAAAFIHSINTRHITLPKMPEDLLVMLTQEPPPPPPPPPQAPRQMVQPTMPRIVVPPVEVQTPPPQELPTVQATTQADPTPARPAQPQATEAPAKSSSTPNGGMRSAVLADANGCAKPAYPPSSLRNEETGTVTLALLVGADGKVTASRIQHSSGYRNLDKAAVSALSLCTFKPAMNNGVPEAGWAQLAYDWKID
jgi:protein TonB